MSRALEVVFHSCHDLGRMPQKPLGYRRRAIRWQPFIRQQVTFLNLIRHNLVWHRGNVPDVVGRQRIWSEIDIDNHFRILGKGKNLPLGFTSTVNYLFVTLTGCGESISRSSAALIASVKLSSGFMAISYHFIWLGYLLSNEAFALRAWALGKNGFSRNSRANAEAC